MTKLRRLIREWRERRKAKVVRDHVEKGPSETEPHRGYAGGQKYHA
jgi:hypothetical protein